MGRIKSTEQPEKVQLSIMAQFLVIWATNLAL